MTVPIPSHVPAMSQVHPSVRRPTKTPQRSVPARRHRDIPDNSFVLPPHDDPSFQTVTFRSAVHGNGIASVPRAVRTADAGQLEPRACALPLPLPAGIRRGQPHRPSFGRLRPRRHHHPRPRRLARRCLRPQPHRGHPDRPQPHPTRHHSPERPPTAGHRRLRPQTRPSPRRPRSRRRPRHRHELDR